jgi:hypothetical protein
LYSFVGNGTNNTASGCGAFVGGGICNSALCVYDTIAGGFRNTTSGAASFAAGADATASAYTSIAMGKFVTASGQYSTASGYYSIASGNYSIAMGCNVTNSISNTFLTNTLRACNIFGAGAICANSVGSIVPVTSDCRLKENILPLDLGLCSVLSLNPVSYEWKDKESGCGRHIGFIAQEIKEIIPSSVFQTASGYYGFDMNKVVPVLTNSIKELKGCNDSLKYEIDILKNILKNNNLA